MINTFDATDVFEAHRGRMFGIAYRMLGSAAEAEDVVQDAWLRWNADDRGDVRHPGAWLAKTVTRLCLNQLDSARVRREEYVGPWLPEPVLTGDGTLGPLESAEQRDGVSMALLVLLEQLSPAERAVYVLREAFGYGHAEIAALLDQSEANCRQLYRRASQRVAAPRPRFRPDPEEWQGLVAGFMAAAQSGDLARLERLLAADVVYVSDGGGVVNAARRPILGPDRVARFLVGALRKYVAGVPVSLAEINGAPSLVFAGVAVVQFDFDFEEGRVTAVRTVVNPEKLAFLTRQLSRPGDLPAVH
ncbi:RNA polymerase sigma-70 factor [Streptomyces sp. NPDC012888]|uniref:RNA polymerase sigma-70 factor n=1 Tax=Streptomyces sp. NPDC012888 TaxID=3364855 RepID=UPI00369CCE35